MAKEKPNIDVDKLRGLMRRRNAFFAQTLALTDEFTALRDEKRRMESQIKYRAQTNQNPPNATAAETAQIEALQQQIDQVQRDRSGQSRDGLDCVPALAQYASRLGYRVDEDAATVVWPAEGSVREVEAPAR